MGVAQRTLIASLPRTCSVARVWSASGRGRVRRCRGDVPAACRRRADLRGGGGCPGLVPRSRWCAPGRLRPRRSTRRRGHRREAHRRTLPARRRRDRGGRRRRQGGGRAVADGGDDVASTVDLLGDAELAQVVGVLRERRSDDRGTGEGGELDGETADTACRAHDQDRLSLRESELNGGECGDASEWGDARRGEVERGGFRRDLPRG